MAVEGCGSWPWHQRDKATASHKVRVREWTTRGAEGEKMFIVGNRRRMTIAEKLRPPISGLEPHEISFCLPLFGFFVCLILPIHYGPVTFCIADVVCPVSALITNIEERSVWGEII